MANDGNKSDPSYSLYHSDHPGMVLVSKPLNGDNYSTWRRAITISLNAKSKFGFVDGTLKASSAETKLEDYPTWKKCNDMVFSWILNSLAPDIADNIIKLWDELGSYNDAVCTCGENNKRCKLMQFLMGLDESYSVVRGQLLLMIPLPDVSQAYSSIIQEENLRNLGTRKETIEASAMVVQKEEPIALAVRHKYGSSSRPNSNYRKPLHCSHCDRDHHTKETCWKLHSYPHGQSKHSTNKHYHSKPNDKNQSSANHVREAPTTHVQPIVNGLTELQLQQILSVIQGSSGASQSVAPKANNANLSSGLSTPKLIIDSGVLDNSKENTSLPPVVMPNGDQAPILSIGNLPLSPIIYLKNVLGVPSWKVDLMSVSRVTRDLNCSVTFFPQSCVLQDLMTGTTIGLGEQRDGLYYLVTQSYPVNSYYQICLYFQPYTSNPSSILWHRCLGHLSYSRLDFLAKKFLHFCLEKTNNCNICALARQTRLPFPPSSISSVKPFELIHCDIWGPFKVSSLSGAKYFLTIVDDFSRFTWVFFHAS
uniref:Retrovirus-related Pol polyprotein from transposon TNT 1-94 n=1 Tax=Cajanus cajan TaxID=3821 RepID=A0A151TF56_CAJCA|nr:Retrovirus-related Pol polyprotein from transposon TNT 1-94 [Cajanus cajan]